MKTIFAVLFSAISFFASSQSHYLSVKGGMNLSSINDDIQLQNAQHFQAGLNLGIGYTYHTDGLFHYGMDILFAQRGYKLKFTLTDDELNEYGEDWIRYKMDYISIPIKVGISHGETFNYFGNIGIMPSFLLKATNIFPAFKSRNIFSGETYFEDVETDYSDKCQSFDLGILLEVGMNYKFHPDLCAFISLGYQHGFLSLSTENYFEGSTILNYGFTSAIGVAYQF